MARYRKDYSGERRTEKVTVQLTPSERLTLETAASRAGARSLSEHARELCLRRSTVAVIVEGARRDAHDVALVRELTAIGNNLNQLTRVANTNRASPQLTELDSVTGLLKTALRRIVSR